MKISEFIEELEIIKDTQGDFDVVVWPYDGQVCYSKDIEIQIDVDEFKKPIVCIEG